METKKIFYQTDFRLVETSNAGVGVPFRFTYYTANPKKCWVATYDGQEYTTVTLGDNVYGYAFTDPDPTEGFLVDKDGNVYQAKELGEEGSRALVDKTL